ncbi:MAG: serine hydrolase domain-containing protein [Chloroflexota bacterium]
MPNEPRGRSAVPHSRPPERSRGSSPARVVLGMAAVIGLAVILGGVAGGALGPAGPTVAVAGGSPTPAAPGTSSPGSGSPSPAASTASPTAIPASPTPAGSPSPSASPGPSSLPTAPPPAADVPAEQLQARLDQLRRKLSIPGLSVAILWDDGRSWLGVSGRADVAGRRPVTPDSGFALASISKTFTAAVVLQLVDEGRLALDEPVAPRLPDYPLDRRITVRMLLDHTSGLPDFFLSKRIDKALQSVPDETWTPAQAWSYVPRRRAVPGTVWSYANTNYLLLGELVESVTGRSLAREVRERLLDPLDLEDTWYQAVEKPRASLTIGYRLIPRNGGGVRPVAVARTTTVMPFRSVITAAGGAGSLGGTARDAARWMQALAGGRVLSEAMQQAMIGDAVTTSALGAKVPYGLGIQVVTLAGRTAIGHSGRYLGFRNVVRYLPAEGVTIAVLTNQGAADPSRVAAALLRIVLPKLVPIPAPSPSASPAP